MIKPLATLLKTNIPPVINNKICPPVIGVVIIWIHKMADLKQLKGYIKIDGSSAATKFGEN